MGEKIILSLGAGVQSTALLIMSNLGLYNVPRADYAIFADTGDEPGYVYRQVDRLQRWSEIPVRIVQHGHLSKDTLSKPRFASIPAFTQMDDGKEGMLRRQCTREYKITPITKEIRRLLGYKPRQRIKEQVSLFIGISQDEYWRAKPNQTPWITNTWPLIDARLSRFDCINLLQEHGFPNFKKSSCVFCPYHDDRFWLWLRSNHPNEFEKAVEFDEAIRNKFMKGIKQPMFIHRTLKPLAEVEFKNEKQLDLFQYECEGMCGV